MASEGISTLVDELEKHLISVFQNPSLPLDERLLEDCEKTLPERISKDDSDGLIAMFAQLLPTLQQDPTVATKVLVRLLQPYPLSAVLSFQPAVDFVGGLSTYNVPFNHLMLSILEKAGKVRQILPPSLGCQQSFSLSSSCGCSHRTRALRSVLGS